MTRRAPLAATGTLPPGESPLIPRLRGVLHHYSFYVAVGLGLMLVLFASSLRGRVAMAIYACALAGCLGVSALYHRGRWSTPVKARLGRLDHSMIFLLIAGTYTPFCLLALSGSVATLMLIAIWCGAAAGITLTLLWWKAPTLVEVAPYVLLGWVAAFAIPQFVSVLGWTALGLLIGGGALYSVGAVVYTTEWPNPRPATFGFHEIFHCLVVAAAGIHLATIMVFLLPRA